MSVASVFVLVMTSATTLGMWVVRMMVFMPTAFESSLPNSCLNPSHFSISGFKGLKKRITCFDFTGFVGSSKIAEPDSFVIPVR